LKRDHGHHPSRTRPFSAVGIEPLRMAGRTEVGMPHMCRGHAGGAQLQQDRLLEVEIEMSWTAGLVDRVIGGKLGLEWFGTGVIDLVTAAADPRPDSGEHRLRLQMELLTEKRDGRRYDLHRGPFPSRMHNAHSRLAGSDQDNREAICRDDGNGKMWTIGDEPISRHPSDELRVSGLGQNDESIAMNLPEGHEIMGIEADRLSEPSAVLVNAHALITTPET
jgi:hypothetical protein